MTDLIEDVRVTGKVLIDGEDIYRPGTDLLRLRKKVGMVFQRPNPFPLSVFDNVVYGLRVHGLRDAKVLEEKLTRSLEAVHLWDELKDRLDENALTLSGEQQQRLCIARLVAVEPEILLMDEPCSALDLAATANIEDLMAELKKRYTIVIVTHNMQQAARVSDVTGYFLLGELVEIGETRQIFTNPAGFPDGRLHHGHASDSHWSIMNDERHSEKPPEGKIRSFLRGGRTMKKPLLTASLAAAAALFAAACIMVMDPETDDVLAAPGRIPANGRIRGRRNARRSKTSPAMSRSPAGTRTRGGRRPGRRPGTGSRNVRSGPTASGRSSPTSKSSRRKAASRSGRVPSTARAIFPQWTT